MRPLLWDTHRLGADLALQLAHYCLVPCHLPWRLTDRGTDASSKNAGYAQHTGIYIWAAPKVRGHAKKEKFNATCKTDMLSRHCSRSCRESHAHLAWNGHPTYSHDLNKFTCFSI